MVMDKVIAGLECCVDMKKGCKCCPYDDGIGQCNTRVVRDALEVIRELKIRLDGAKHGRLELARQFQELESEKAALEAKYATAVEMTATATELAAKYRRTDGEQELRTCYCPLCDKHFKVRSNASSGNCPDCGHHVVLRCEEVADV